jgi:transcriptional regulator with XRE-family HTH domain
MNTATMPEKKVHEGKNIKRIREMLGIKQETLASELEISQQSVSLLEQKETIESTTLEAVAKVLKVPVEAIKNFNEEMAVNFISNTFRDYSVLYAASYSPTFNPMDKVVELYERLLQTEREKVEILQGKK